MNMLSRWLAPAVLAAGLGFGAMTPAPVQAQDSLTRVLVDVADVVLRSGVPYYRYGDYGYNDRLVAGRDRYRGGVATAADSVHTDKAVRQAHPMAGATEER